MKDTRTAFDRREHRRLTVGRVMNGRRRLLGQRVQFMVDLIVCVVECEIRRWVRLVFVVTVIEDIAFHFMIMFSFADGRRGHCRARDRLGQMLTDSRFIIHS